MIREVRICELCNEINEPNSMECHSCGEDLACIPVTDSYFEMGEWFRSEDLACIPVTTVDDSKEIENDCLNKEIENIKNEAERKKTITFIERELQNKIDGKIVKIPLDGCILGRDGDIEVKYFEQFPFISNVHASFEYLGDELIIKDEGSTNGTKVNGEKLIPNMKRNIYQGDVVKLANIEFIVK